MRKIYLHKRFDSVRSNLIQLLKEDIETHLYL
jgi:hypothetical protein